MGALVRGGECQKNGRVHILCLCTKKKGSILRANNSSISLLSVLGIGRVDLVSGENMVSEYFEANVGLRQGWVKYIYLYPQGQRFTEPLQGLPSMNQAWLPPLQGSTIEIPGPDLWACESS